MYMADERRACILRMLAEEGKVRSRLLVKEFGVTDETIRTDLEQLGQAGLLRRVRGGAVYLPPGGHEEDAARPDCQLAALAASHIPHGAVVYADDSLYLPALATALAQRECCVVTSLPGHLAQLGSATLPKRVYCLGGRLDVASGLAVPETWPTGVPQPQVAVLTPQGVTAGTVSYNCEAAARLAGVATGEAPTVLLLVPSAVLGVEAEHAVPCTPACLITEDAVPPELAHLTTDLIPRLTPEQLRAESEFDY